MPIRPVPLSVALVVCGLLVATAVVMTLQSLALAADGSYYLVRILGDETVFGPNGRLLANVVRQAPVLLAAWAGVNDTQALSVLLGLGQLVLPAAIWSVAILLSRPQGLTFAAVSTTAGICLGTTYFFNVSESVLAVPLTALVGCLLWQPGAWRWPHAVLAATSAAVLVASYETAAVTGVVLAVWALWRSRLATSATERYGTAIVAVASALSVVTALVAAASGKGPSNARSSLYFVLSGDPWPLYVAIVGSAAVLASSMTGALRTQWLLLGGGVACLTAAVAGVQTTSVAAFQARGGAVLASLLLLLFLFWLWAPVGESRRSATHAVGQGPSRRWVVAIPVVFVAAMATVNLIGTTRWSRSLDAFRAEVDRRAGIVPVDTALPHDRRQVVWDWTSSSLSLVVRSEPASAILVDPDPSFIPFPPGFAAEQLSDVYTWRGDDRRESRETFW